MKRNSILKKVTAVAIMGAMVCGYLPGTYNTVATEVYAAEVSTEELKTISVNIGETESQMIFTWLSKSANESFVVVKDSTGAEVANVVATQTDYTSEIEYYSYTATVDCFTSEGDYTYVVGNEDKWSDEETIHINDNSDNAYSFIAAGDPQIGSSESVSDGEGWSTTLDLASSWWGDSIDFLVSVGDQVNASRSAYAEDEYDAYFSAELLASIPSSVVAGNHEIYTYSTYSAHFTAPSTVDTTTASSIAGDESGDYWYAYEGTLFLCLNSNVYDSTAVHYNFIEDAIAEYTAIYGESPTWQIVTFHHSIYSSASHYADSDILTRQSTWADMFSDLDIDVVLMGHDHVYTRSVMMQGTNPTEYADNSTEDIADYVIDPEDGEVLYVTLNSASGSKYYSIQNYDLDYVAVKDQTNTPTITKVDVTDSELKITTYYTSDGSTLEDVVDEFSIIRSTTTDSASKPAVTEDTYSDIHAPELTVPADSTVYLGDTYDVTANVSAEDENYGYYETEGNLDLTDSIVITGSVDTTVPGEYTVNYYVEDAAGNTTAKSVTVTVVERVVLLDDTATWTTTTEGTTTTIETTFNVESATGYIDSLIAAYTSTANAVIYINGVEAGTYTVVTSSKPGQSSSTTGTLTLESTELYKYLVVGENTITIEFESEDSTVFSFTSLDMLMKYDVESSLEPTYYPASSIEEVDGLYNDENELNATLISSFSIGGSDEDGGLVEIVCYNTDAMVAYAVSGSTGELIVVDMSSLTTAGLSALGYNMEELVGEIDGFVYGDMSSVAVNSDSTKLAVALQAEDYAANGLVAIFDLDADGNVTGYPTFVACGVQPDALTFTPDGTTVLVANEGEPREGYGDGVVDPEGSVTIIDMATLSANTVNFDDVAIDSEVLIKSGATASEDLEPEFISATNTVAYVALQENNAIAVLDLTTGQFTGVYGLGFIDYSEVAIDIESKDEVYDSTTYENLYGIRMPDGITVYEMDGKTYLYTANEGDGREWGEGDNEYVNEVKSTTSLTGNIETTGKVTWFNPEDYEMLDQDSDYLFGARSFSIFEVTADGLTLVYDSGEDFSAIVAELLPEYFNCSNDDISVEDRTAKKGVEPEYTTVGEVDGEIYAFTGLERQGGIMIYNVTDPANAYFVNYINSRDYSEDIAGDVAPEGLAFVSASDSATGNALLLVANEVSGTMSVIELTSDMIDVDGDDASGNENDDADSESENGTTDDDTSSDDVTVNGSTTDDLVGTGDNTNIAVYVYMMLFAIAGVSVILYRRKLIRK